MGLPSRTGYRVYVFCKVCESFCHDQACSPEKGHFIFSILTGAYYSILPALAFSLDMFEKTQQSYGVNEVLLASVLGSVVFSVAAAQPLVIVGVTGKFQRRKVN